MLASFAQKEDCHAFMADSQVQWGVDALSGTISEPAWNCDPRPDVRFVPIADISINFEGPCVRPLEQENDHERFQTPPKKTCFAFRRLARSPRRRAR